MESPLEEYSTYHAYYACQSDSAMDARQLLRDEIKHLVALHADADPPPFTSGEMIVMSIIDGNFKYSRKTDMVKWILKAFPCYKAPIIDSMRAVFEFQDTFLAGASDCLACINDDANKALMSYEVPLIEFNDKYTVKVDCARQYLGKWLQEPEREGTFPIMDLPPELRLRLYEELLLLPGSTVKVSKRGESFELQACQRDTKPSFEDSEYMYPYSITKPSNILSVTAVCRQMAREAIPVFFSNTFKFSSTTALSKFVAETTAHRLRHIKRLAFEVNIYPMSEFTLTTNMGNAIARLNEYIVPEHLTVWLRDCICNDSWWTGPGARDIGDLLKPYSRSYNSRRRQRDSVS